MLCPGTSRRTRRGAFTLIELIVVIVILGVLAALAVPGYQAVQARSVRSTSDATLNALQRSAAALATSEQRADQSGQFYAQAAQEITVESGARLLVNPHANSASLTRRGICRRITAPTNPAAPGALASCPALPAEILADAPVGYWRLGERAGATVEDWSGNGHHAALSGTVTRGQPSLLAGDDDTSTEFGGNARAVAAAHSDFTVNAVTVHAWVEIPAVWGGAGTYRVLLSKQDGLTVAGRDFNVYLYSSDGTNVTRMHTSSGQFGATSRGLSTPLIPGSRHQVVFTATPTEHRYYVDGELVGVAAASGTGGPAGDAEPVQLGAADNFWLGKLDEVALYGTVLTGERIRQLYRAATVIQ